MLLELFCPGSLPTESTSLALLNYVFLLFCIEFLPAHKMRKPSCACRSCARDGEISESRLRCVSCGSCGKQWSSISRSDACWIHFFCRVAPTVSSISVRLLIELECASSPCLLLVSQGFNRSISAVCRTFSRCKECHFLSSNFRRFSASRFSVD